MIRKGLVVALLLIVPFLLTSCGGGGNSASEATEVRLGRGAGGVGFLPLLVMEKNNLIQTHAKKQGIPDLKVTWLDLGGPANMNDALLSDNLDFIAAGPPSFLLLWDKTQDTKKVKSVAAMTSLPMYLNVRGDKLKKLEDFTNADKIGMTAIGVSIPAIVMQMYAEEKYGLSEAKRFDKYTVSMTHPDGVIALRRGSGGIAAHFTSPPFHLRELKDSAIHTIMTTDDVMKGSTTFTMLSTTSAFHDRNPKIVAAVLAALEEATKMIREDKKAVADILSSSEAESGLTPEELMEVLGDPAVKFTTTPENVMKYAEFMHRTGLLKNKPESWKDLFFPEIHGVPGN